MHKIDSSRFERILLTLWLLGNLIIGMLIVPDYGISIDEPAIFLYAQQSVDAYQSFFARLFEPVYGPSNLRFYGPAFFMLVESISRALDAISIEIPNLVVWHYAYFMLFQLTGLCLFALTKRWFSSWTAWGVLVLFVTQPLLWGHAFINPKDIPFLFVFTFSVWSGFRMLDAFGPQPKVSIPDIFHSISHLWQAIQFRRRVNFLIGMALVMLALLLALSFANIVIEWIVTFFYTAESGTIAGNIMSAFSTNTSSIPLTDYVHKAKGLSAYIGWRVFVVSLIMLLGYLYYPQIRSRSVAFPNQIARFRILKPSWVRSLTSFIRVLFSPRVILAGIVLGMATAVRVLAPLAGLVVLLVLWVKDRKKFVPVASAYLIWAGISTYLAWPYLWLSPISRYVETLGMMSSFPWNGEVLFIGQFYSPANLPFSYVPLLLNIQLTEIFLISFYVGAGFLIWHAVRAELRVDLLIYVTLGSLLPLGGIVVLRSPMYDNFRQLFFLLPGLYLIAAFALEAVFERLQSSRLRIALVTLIAVLGMLPLFQLHPYQYIYYNSLVGGQAGAFRRFESDYWGISAQELTLELNRISEPGEKIVVLGTKRLINYYIRPDLILERAGETTYDLDGGYDYAILPSRWNNDQYYPDAEVIKIVERQGAILGVIKQVRGERFE